MVVTNRNSKINKEAPLHEEDTIPKVNRDNATSMIREIHAKGHVIDIPITRVGNLTSQSINIAHNINN